MMRTDQTGQDDGAAALALFDAPRQPTTAPETLTDPVYA